MVSRRQFLGAGLANAAFWLAPGVLGSTLGRTASVVVIGAGMAGLTAARRLQQFGFDVTVLEGRDRTGGRIWTRDKLGFPLDHGAAWIYGHSRANPIARIAERIGLEVAPTDFRNSATFDFDGSPVSGPESVESYRNLSRISEQARTIVPGWQQDGPWGAALRQAYERFGWDLNPRQLRLLLLNMVTSFELTPAEEVDRLSSRHLTLNTATAGIPSLVHGGLSQVIDAVADGLNISTGHIVTRIRYDDAGVRIDTSRGGFAADYVLVTVPLGVLKSGAIEFAPTLPDWKLDAIDRIGFGTYSKINLLFDRPFWPDRHVFYYAAADKGDYPFWVNIDEHLGAPVLSIQQVGTKARDNDRRTLEEAVDRAMVAVRTMFGASSPDPVGATHTNWSVDPFALGSYSYHAVGTTPEDRSALGAPIADRLFFAGEAVHPTYFATAHGALMSGEWAAGEVARVAID